MLRRPVICLAAVALCLGAVLGIAYFLPGDCIAQPPETGVPGDCNNPTDYKNPSWCKRQIAGCLQEDPLWGWCVGYGFHCPGDTCFPNPTCQYFKVSPPVQPIGYCEIDLPRPSGLPSDNCVRCDYFCCAAGQMYDNMTSCYYGLNARCSAVYWTSAACKPVAGF